MSPIFIQATTTTTTILLLSLLLSTPTTTTADIVLDSQHNPIVAGSYYYGWSLDFTQIGVLPYLDGWLTMFNNGTLSCPSFIVSTSINSSLGHGIRIKFTPEIPTGKNMLHTSTNLNIAFEYLMPEPKCRKRYTTVWTVSENAVVLNGEEGSRGSWFKLVNVGSLTEPVYSIWYEHKVVLFDRQPNGQVLLSLEKGHPILLTFLTHFKKFPDYFLHKNYSLLNNIE